MNLSLKSKNNTNLKAVTAIALGLAVFIPILAPNLCYPLLVLAQKAGVLKFPPAPQQGSPTSTIGGGRRLFEDLPNDLRSPYENAPTGDSSQTCVNPKAKPLTPLLPTALGYDSSTTSLANPTLYFYLPQTTARQVAFVITDTNNNKVFSEIYTVPGQAGIWQLTLPDNVALEKNKEYWWELALICNPQKRQSDKFVQGKLKRLEIQADLKAQIARQTSPVEKAKHYAQAKIWQETLTTLAQIYGVDPQAWKDLLTSAGLGEFAQAPFLNK
jgi:hypothetical protein